MTYFALKYNNSCISDIQWNRLSTGDIGSVWTAAGHRSRELRQSPDGGTETYQTSLRNEGHQKGACKWGWGRTRS